MAKKIPPPDPRWWNLRQLLSTNIKHAMDKELGAYGNKPAELQIRSGVSDSVIRRLVFDPHGIKEKYNYPTIETLAQLAEALRVTLESLLHDPNAKTPPVPVGGGGSTTEIVPATSADSDPSKTPGRPLIHEPA